MEYIYGVRVIFSEKSEWHPQWQYGNSLGMWFMSLCYICCTSPWFSCCLQGLLLQDNWHLHSHPLTVCICDSDSDICDSVPAFRPWFKRSAGMLYCWWPYSLLYAFQLKSILVLQVFAKAIFSNYFPSSSRSFSS